MNAGLLGKLSQARILVVDDHPLIREGLIGLINQQQDLICCGQAATVAEAIAAVDKDKPDLVILDLRLKGGDGLELIGFLKAMSAESRILIFSQHYEQHYVERALNAGAMGYVTKDRAATEILSAIRTVLAGQVFLSRGTAALMLHKLVGPRRRPCATGEGSLTDRELHVLQLLGTGMGTRAIALELKRSFKTIETHRENIKRKMGLTGAAQLVQVATNWAREKIALPRQELTNSAWNDLESSGRFPTA
jgi:DNA-binding NarL/FixJ family response regulator